MLGEMPDGDPRHPHRTSVVEMIIDTHGVR